MANIIGEYAQYDDFELFSYRAITYLMNNNEMVWKLLMYTTPDAWNKPNLTQAEKASLIYNGEDDGSKFRVFMDDGLPDVQTREDTILRISPYFLKGLNRNVGDLLIRIEFYSHWKINHLSNYTTRTDLAVKHLLKTFNGSVIGGIGKLHFDAAQSASTNVRVETTGQIPFKGKAMFFGNKVA